VAGSASGFSFDTLTVDVPVYLNYLLSRFLAGGGKIVRGSVQHINQLLEGGASVFGDKSSTLPDALIVCVGLGALTLGGVEDKAMHPIRGQTVLVRAPWIRDVRILYGENNVTYLIPRRSGDVVVGGTFDPDDWYPIPRPETTRAILERAFAFSPDLTSPEARAQGNVTLDDIAVVEEGCGLRPGRKGGVRLEVEWVNVARREVPLIHNYGHGPYGFQSSWGSASVAMTLLESALAKIRRL